MTYFAGNYDVIVVGAGHAGSEAALASARLGQKTLLLTINLDAVAMLPCNPSIGGTGKGHLVREIDALGGEMGKIIDQTMIQCRMLNTGKGPAVHSLRAQTDKWDYQNAMRSVIENQDNLTLKQQEAVELFVDGGKVKGVGVQTGAVYHGKTVILCTGTYLRAKIFIGETQFYGGPGGLAPSMAFSDSLEKCGIPLQRFKTGTPARVDKRTLDFSKMSVQEGDVPIVPFSFDTEAIDIEQIPCYLTYTNEEGHQIIRENITRSPLHLGDIKGVGARYCPSIDTLVERFADKDRHQVFIEPEGRYSNELYVQGMSSCLPEEVQISVYRTVPGMEKVEIMRPAYAIDYDCIIPGNLTASLEYMGIEGLFCAGQINGTSGYEEAAAQGLIAGINAVHKIQGKPPLILDRSQAYIGVLIDDIITKSADEPYRMMTSRSEYRLLLRQDNADLRLTPTGYDIGLISEERYQRFLKKREQIEAEKQRLQQVLVRPETEVNSWLASLGQPNLKNTFSLAELLKRPQITNANSRLVDPQRPELPQPVWEQVEVQIKYAGYIDKQIGQVRQFQKLENKRLATDLDYRAIHGLRIEAIEKLCSIRPESVGQAGRISGVSPADISVLLVYLDQQKRLKEGSGDDHS